MASGSHFPHLTVDFSLFQMDLCKCPFLGCFRFSVADRPCRLLVICGRCMGGGSRRTPAAIFDLYFTGMGPDDRMGVKSSARSGCEKPPNDTRVRAQIHGYTWGFHVLDEVIAES